MVWFNTAPISGGIQTIILTKVEEGLDHVQSTGFSFIISTSDYSRVTIGGATCKIPSCRLLWLPPCAGRHGYLLCLFDFIIAYVTATNFSRHQFPSSSLSDGLDKSRDGFQSSDQKTYEVDIMFNLLRYFAFPWKFQL